MVVKWPRLCRIWVTFSDYRLQGERTRETDMQTIKEGMASLSLLASLNLDRAIVLFLIVASLFAASYMVAM